LAAGRLRFFLPSVTDLVFLVLLVSLSCGVLAPRLLGDGGIGWHIRNGEQMLRLHAITRNDPFSSTMQGQPWYAWEWLYDLLIARIHQGMGLNGVVFFTALVIAGTFAFALRLTLARGGNLPLTLTLLGLAVAASAIHLLARPHVLSWLLVVIWFERLDAWDRAVHRASDRALFWLPVLMLVWVNLHGGFLTGFILLGLYCAGNFLRSLTAPEFAERQVAGKRLRLLGIVTLLALVATLANPYGYKLHVHIFAYLSNRFLMNHIEEFLSPNFHGLAEQGFALLLGITMIALAAEREKPRPSLLLVILFAAGSGLYAARNLPVSSILLLLGVTPILSRAAAGAGTHGELASWLRRWFSRFESFASRMTRMELSLRGHAWPVLGVVLGLGICAHGGWLGSWQIMDAHFSPQRFPVLATEEIARRDIHAPIFCPDFWGGYLIYRLYPQTPVVLDDRHDLYGEAFFKNYLKVIRGEPGWESVLVAERVDWVLVPAESTLANLLSERPEWTTVYRDTVAVLYRRSSR